MVLGVLRRVEARAQVPLICVTAVHRAAACICIVVVYVSCMCSCASEVRGGIAPARVFIVVVYASCMCVRVRGARCDGLNRSASRVRRRARSRLGQEYARSDGSDVSRRTVGG